MSQPTGRYAELDEPYALTDDQVRFFRKRGYIKLKRVFSKGILDHYGAEISRQVKALNKQDRPVEARDTYGKAFLQVTNIWEHSQVAKEFVFSRRLAGIATELLGTRGVRMYHDQALYKEAGGGFTPWHVDQHYWPLASNLTVTAWVPLHAVPMDMGPLMFSEGSQEIRFGRDLAISDESEAKIDRHLKMSDLPVNNTPFDLGEVSFHFGYTFHRAGPNTTDKPREVMTVIYMDRDMRLIEPRSEAQKRDWKAWCEDVRPGEIIDSPRTPVLYSVD